MSSSRCKDLGDKAKREGDNLAGAKPLGWLARAGLVARGLVYLIIGVLALELALGEGGKAANQQDALKTIADQSFGKALLVLVAIGLAGYALWRLIRAAVGHGAEQRDSGSDRVAALASGIAYGVLCVTAVEIISRLRHRSSGTPKEATGGVLGWSGGTVLVAIAGAALIGVAVYQAYKGLAKKFLDDAKTGEMSEGVRKGYTALGVFGHVARAVDLRAGRLRADQGRGRLQPERGDRARRRAAPARRCRPTAPRCWASSPPGWRGSRSTRSPTPATAGESEAGR